MAPALVRTCVKVVRVLLHRSQAWLRRWRRHRRRVKEASLRHAGRARQMGNRQHCSTQSPSRTNSPAHAKQECKILVGRDLAGAAESSLASGPLSDRSYRRSHIGAVPSPPPSVNGSSQEPTLASVSCPAPDEHRACARVGAVSRINRSSVCGRAGTLKQAKLIKRVCARLGVNSPHMDADGKQKEKQQSKKCSKSFSWNSLLYLDLFPSYPAAAGKSPAAPSEIEMQRDSDSPCPYKSLADRQNTRRRARAGQRKGSGKSFSSSSVTK